MSKKMSFNKPCKYVESHCEKIKAELAEAKCERDTYKAVAITWAKREAQALAEVGAMKKVEEAARESVEAWGGKKFGVVSVSTGDRNLKAALAELDRSRGGK